MSKSLGNYIAAGRVGAEVGGEILRLWCAATDYSSDLGIDDKILARVVDAYRRIRNTLRFLLANTSDFDGATQAVPIDQLLEIDRYALARTAELQAQVLAHYEVYEFHPVVAKLQIFCSEDLGAFYLDVLKDRLYTTRREQPGAAQRADRAVAHHPRHAALDGAVPQLHRRRSLADVRARPLGVDLHRDLQRTSGWADAALLAKWSRIREIRDAANKVIEEVRGTGKLGSSLQANLVIHATAADHALLASLGDDLKFVTITSAVALHAGR